MISHSIREIAESDANWIVEACQDKEILFWTTVPRPYELQHAQGFIRGEFPEYKIWVIEDKESKAVGIISIHTVDEGGNAESCSFSTAQAGTYHVMLNGYSAYSGVSLVADYTAASGGGGDQGATLTETNISIARRTWKHYTVTVPAGMSNLTVTTSGGSGDADLYVRRGAQPTTSSYDCRPYKSGNAESCSFTNPQAAVWHISVYGYSAVSGLTLTATYQP